MYYTFLANSKTNHVASRKKVSKLNCKSVIRQILQQAKKSQSIRIYESFMESQ